MTNFWYPYSGLPEATQRLGSFADRAFSPTCGISFSDGQSISIVRRPHASSAGTAQWFNVLREHIAAPLPTPPKSNGAIQRMEHWFDQAMTAYGQSELDNSRATIAGANAANAALDAHIWQPTHQWMLKHKLVADGVGVVGDVVGVVAGVAFIMTVGLELGVLAAITGVLALAGSAILFVCDGSVFATEVTGNEVISKKIESNKTIQWLRVVGTIMILPDIPVGGVRALEEVGSLAGEAKVAKATAINATTDAATQRARIEKIRNPNRHPEPVQRHAHRAVKFAQLAVEKEREAVAAMHRLVLVALRDVNASFVASPVSAGLMAGAPPEMVLSKDQQQKDERLISLLAPEHGMPRDVKFQMRVSSVTRSSAK